MVDSTKVMMEMTTTDIEVKAKIWRSQELTTRKGRKSREGEARIRVGGRPIDGGGR